jgi:preprotein translocase subunit YajC
MKVAKLLAMAAVVGLFSYAVVAAEGDAPKPERPKGIRGKITKVGEKSITIESRASRDADPKTIEIAVDDKTTVKIEDKDAKVADLKADMRVFITPETASDKVAAVTITVMKPRAPKPKE